MAGSVAVCEQFIQGIRKSILFWGGRKITWSIFGVVHKRLAVTVARSTSYK